MTDAPERRVSEVPSVTEEAWRDVEAYLQGVLVTEDDALRRTRERTVERGLAPIEVAPTHGKMLHLLARMIGARRVLEIGTLAGYSTIWLARAVGPTGHVTSLEIDETALRVAYANLANARVVERVDIVLGSARDSLDALLAADVEPFDLVFIDADKENNAAYVERALGLCRVGAVIVVDNVVRGGTVIDPEAGPDVQGVRACLELLAAHPRLDATAVQTLSGKGWDGLAVALVTE